MEVKTLHKEKIVVIGGANIDIKGYSSGQYIDNTSNPGKVISSSGGVGRNIAQNLAYFDVDVSLLSAVGDDLYGKKIIKESKKSGINLEHILRLKGKKSGVYLAVLDQQGELMGGVSDMDILENLNKEYLLHCKGVIEEAYIIVIDSNLSHNTLDFLFTKLKKENQIIIANPVSVEKGKKLIRFLDEIDYLVTNKQEFCAILEIDKNYRSVKNEELKYFYNLSKKRCNFIITDGSRPVIFLGEDFYQEFDVDMVKKEDIIETTGAGDAFTAGFIYGIFSDKNLAESIEIATKKASATIKSKDTVVKNKIHL